MIIITAMIRTNTFAAWQQHTVFVNLEAMPSRNVRQPVQVFMCSQMLCVEHHGHVVTCADKGREAGQRHV